MSLPATQALAEAARPVTIKVTHTRTRTTEENWERSDAHCPACGSKGRVCRMLDYPLAFDALPHACLTCGAQFSLGMARADRLNDGDIARVNSLREAFPSEGGA